MLGMETKTRSTVDEVRDQVETGIKRSWCSEKTNLLWCNWSLVLLAEVLDGLGITAQVLLASHKHHGHLGAEMHDFSDPLYSPTVVRLGGCFRVRVEVPYLFLHVLERVGQVDSKADEDNM